MIKPAQSSSTLSAIILKQVPALSTSAVRVEDVETSPQSEIGAEETKGTTSRAIIVIIENKYAFEINFPITTPFLLILYVILFKHF